MEKVRHKQGIAMREQRHTLMTMTMPRPHSDGIPPSWVRLKRTTPQTKRGWEDGGEVVI